VLMLSQSIEHADCPEVKGKIRMHMLAAGLGRMEGEYLHVTEFTQMDLKGYVPAKLMNMVLGSMAKAQMPDFY